MQCKRSWTISIAVLILLTAATRYVSAQVESRAASQTVGEDANDTVTFRVRIQNISPDDGVPTLFAPGAWVLHSKANPLFKNGDADRGEGLESLAEDGNPAKLVETLRGKGLTAGSFNTPVCADTPGPLPSGNTVEFGDSYEFEVTTSPETPYLSFATMLVQSNDLFLAPSEKGIALFNDNGTAVGVQDLTAELILWDAGTETNEKPGVGPNQAPRQSDANTGPADNVAKVRPVNDGFSYPKVTDLVKVYIVQVPMVERDRGRQLVSPPDHSIREIFRVGDVQWQALSAENLGHVVKNGKGDSLITDERFVLLRFEFLNLGSDPLEFDGGSLRNRKGVLLRDSRSSEYPYYRVPRTGRPDQPPHEFVPKSENCYGEWTWRGWRPYILKPNTPTTCSVIYEVSVDAMEFALIASDLGDGQVSVTETADLNLRPVSRHSVGEYVHVGDVRWQVLSAEELGYVLESNGNQEKTKERFIAVRFQITNKGSADLGFSGAALRDRQGREYERGRFEFIEENERCSGSILGLFVLKPNTITTCTSVYEVPAQATGLIFIASDLGGADDGSEAIDLALSDLVPIPIYILGEDVEVGDVCWRVLSVKDLGKELTNNGDQETTDGRFLQVRFRFLNLGSNTLGYDGVPLGDSQGRWYTHYGKRASFISDDELCPRAVLPLPGPYPLEPNIPTTCTTIYEVANDAAKFILAANDLEGFETALIALPPLTAAPTPTPTVPPGTYEVGKDIAPGVYRGEASADTFCKWARLKDLKDEPESIAAMGLREGPFYLEILDSDAAFTTECKLVPIDHLESHEPLLMSVSPGMYVVGLDIGPGQYKGEPQEGLFCFWQRLNNFREEDDSTIEWDIPGEEYVVEVSPSDFAVEFACPVQKVE